MWLLIAHPEMVGVKCDECVEFVLDDEWQIKRLHNGEAIKRPPAMKTPCWKCPKCAGYPDKERCPTLGRTAELSEKNVKTYQAYMQLQATYGEAPIEIDAIAAQNFGAIHAIVERERRRSIADLTLAYVATRGR